MDKHNTFAEEVRTNEILGAAVVETGIAYKAVFDVMGPPPEWEAETQGEENA